MTGYTIARTLLPLGLASLFAAVLAACGPDAADPQPLQVRGELVLPDEPIPGADAFAIVELADAASSEAPQLGVARIELAGAQSPAPFHFEIDRALVAPQTEYAVTAAVFSDNEAILLSAPVGVDVSGETADAGAVRLEPLGPLAPGLEGGGDEQPAATGEAVYQCGEVPVIVEYAGDAATLHYGEDTFTLERTVEQPPRYEDETDRTTYLIDRGAMAQVSVRGEMIEACIRFF